MVSEIKKYDSEFTESNFKTFVDNAFIQVHMAIMTKEPRKVRHFMTDEVYEQILSRIEDLNERSRIQMFDEMNVKSTEILRIEPLESKLLIEVKIISRYMDYLLDENGNFISGNNTSRVEKENILHFQKNKNAKKLKSVRKCPRCGASVDINANGQCSYCRSTFNLEDKGWVISKFETR